VLRHVVAKLAAATPEAEAASVVAWCRQAAEDELPIYDENFEDGFGYVWNGTRSRPRERRQTECASAALSINTAFLS